jgi:hypothetical protein
LTFAYAVSYTRGHWWFIFFLYLIIADQREIILTDHDIELYRAILCREVFRHAKNLDEILEGVRQFVETNHQKQRRIVLVTVRPSTLSTFLPYSSIGDSSIFTDVPGLVWRYNGAA